MAPTSVYFTQGTKNEQFLIEDLIIESMQIYGQEFLYVPRTLVAKDDILGEDRLSKFENAFPIEMYFESVDSLEGQGAFLQKFGLMMEQSATLVVARRRWEQLVGRYSKTIIPARPCEGDLLFFPLTGGLFEIKFVKHQDPFYQLGRLYVYKLQVELFQYSSERLDTNVTDIDTFESLKTFSTDTSVSRHGGIMTATVVDGGTGYTAATVTFSGDGTGATGTVTVTDGAVSAVTITNTGYSYTTATMSISGDGTGATGTVTVGTNIDNVESYGDNNSLKEEGETIIFDETNPFGDV